MAAVAALHLGVEIPDSRFLDFVTSDAAQLIADRACAHMFVLGREVEAGRRERDLAAFAVQGRTSEGLVHDGGGNVLGDPHIALTWIANELSAQGVTLGEGQFVTTGACVAPLPIGPGDVGAGDYGALGPLQVRFETERSARNGLDASRLCAINEAPNFGTRFFSKMLISATD